MIQFSEEKKRQWEEVKMIRRKEETVRRRWNLAKEEEEYDK